MLFNTHLPLRKEIVNNEGMLSSVRKQMNFTVDKEVCLVMMLNPFLKGISFKIIFDAVIIQTHLKYNTECIIN